MNVTERDRDLGTGYAMKPSTTRTELTEVGARHADGRAAAPLLASGRPRRRRHRHPAQGARAGRGPDPVPRRAGPAGLVHPRCCHRGTSLYYGKVEERRHPLLLPRLAVRRRGPLPRAALRARRRRSSATRCASPGTRSRSATAWSSPTWARPRASRCCRATSASRSWTTASSSRPTTHSIGGGGPEIIPVQLAAALRERGRSVPRADPARLVLAARSSPTRWPRCREVKFETIAARRQACARLRQLDDGKRFYRVTEAALPTLRVVPNPRVAQFGRVESIGWVLPIDDTLVPHLRRRPRQAAGRPRPDALEVQRQVLVGDDRGRSTSDFPGDYEAQVGQGPITLHSDEHLGQSDRGIADAPPDAAAISSTRCRGRPRSDRRDLRSGRGAGGVRGGEFHLRGLSSARRVRSARCGSSGRCGRFREGIRRVS